MNTYSSAFYQTHAEGSRNSAREILPIIMELINPRSVIDVGCGIGTWLSVFRELGVGKIIGIDGDYVNRGDLLIPEESFISFDLRNKFATEEKFDIAISLEVAEHIEEIYADSFVDTLTGLSSFVLFSAAIPWQEGKAHVNEQWQEYWAEKFFSRGYLPIDCIRKKVWKNDKVEVWYAQNMLLYAEENALRAKPDLMAEYKKCPEPLLSVVHPAFFAMRSDPENYYLKDIVASSPEIMKKIVKRRLGPKS